MNGILVALCVFFTVRFIGDHDPGWIVLDVFFNTCDSVYIYSIAKRKRLEKVLHFMFS